MEDLKEELADIAMFSTKLSNAVADNNSLFDYLEALPAPIKTALHEQYGQSTGPVLSLRSSVAANLISGHLDRKRITTTFEQAKKNKPRQYTQYPNLFSILYPFAIYTVKERTQKFLKDLATSLQRDLGLIEQTAIKVNGFEGGRNTGDDHAWLAIYNNSYPNQKAAKQLFLSIHKGKISVSLYHWANQSASDVVELDPQDFNYDRVLEHFRAHKAEILNDNFRSAIIQKHPLEKVINDLKSGAITAWWIKPGAKGAYWKEAFNTSSIYIGWGKVVNDIIEQDNYSNDYVIDSLNKHYPKDDTDNQNNNRISIQSFMNDVKPGDAVFAISGRSDIIGLGIVTSDFLLDEDEDEYPAYHNVDWLIDVQKKPYNPPYLLPIKTVTSFDATSAIKVINKLFERSDNVLTTANPDILKAINQILYGPPGTGKTYKLLKDYFPLFTSKKIEVSEQQYKNSLVSNYTWWQTVAAVVLDLKSARVAEIRNHLLLQTKHALSDLKNVNAMIWAMLQTHTKDDCEFVKYANKYEPLFFNKDKDGNWTLDNAIVDAEAPEVKELLLAWKKPAAQVKEEIKRYEFVTFHQSFSYEDFLEGIKPKIEGESEVGGVEYSIKDGVFKSLCTKARRDPDNRYALFIDEINRGNVSQIFGELITLIEDDKREGALNFLEVELLYSKTKLSVPPNLYIIGTMNTADRSVEALDTALRRRFSFVEMMPRYDLDELQTEVAGFKPSAILRKINDRLEKLLDRDHLIGHSYFINIKSDLEVLKVIFDNKIIPLLKEYFYGDAGKIGLVIGKDFFEPTDETEESVFAEFDYDSAGLNERKVYRLINLATMTNEQFLKAIVSLMR